MNTYEAEAVRDVIEQLVAQIGPEQVEDEIDVEGALELLNREIDNGSEEAGAETSPEAQEEDVV